MKFDRPIYSDPLFWSGVIVGCAVSLFFAVSEDLSVEDTAWRVFTGTVGTTWMLAGVVGTAVRSLYRARRDSKRAQAQHTTEMHSDGPAPQPTSGNQ